MKRAFSIFAFVGSLLLVGCSAATPSVRQPVAPPVQTPVTASSGTARSSDAEPLGMTQQELREQMSEGKSIKDILKSRGVNVPSSSAAAID
ncbi:MAG: hypothetical protein PHZ00_05155 [Candidatus Peribacteraceae bacterium]|nr:hypothetical protein [Candidatus Peribacteraceae bacterium]